MGKPPPSPSEYLHAAIQLHLNASVQDSASLSEIDTFLSPDNNDNGHSNKLFVYVLSTSDGDRDEAHVSTSSLPSKTLGSLAFVHASLSSAASPSTLQCILLSPRLYEPRGRDDGDDNNETTLLRQVQVEQQQSSALSTFANLQSFARHVFLPAVRSVDTETNLDGLEDKLHELDVALGQCRRSALGTVPAVVLKPHPLVAVAAERWDGKENISALSITQWH